MDPRSLRHVALVGRPGAGTAELARALTGDGLWVDHRGVRITVLDTPGDPELAGFRLAALRAADTVLFAVPAVGGLDAVTVQVWAQCTGRPRIVVLTRLDAPGADADEAIALCQRLLDEDVLPLQLPMHDDDGAVGGLLDLLTLTVVEPGGSRPADPEHRTLVEGLRGELVETVLAESEDDALVEAWMAGGDPDVRAELCTAVRRGAFFPAVVVAPAVGVGVTELLDLLVDAGASPLDVPCPAAFAPDGSPVEPLSCSVDGPPVGEVVGPGLVRVWSGRLSAPALEAGELTAVDVPGARVGDVLGGLQLSGWGLPEPQHPTGVPDGDALAAQLRWDPTLRLAPDPDTGQQVLWSLGPVHAAAALEAAGVAAEPLRPPGAEHGVRWVAVRVEVPSGFARTVASDLIGRGAQSVAVATGSSADEPDSDTGDGAPSTGVWGSGRWAHDHEQDDLGVVTGELPWAAFTTYAEVLARVSHGTGRLTRRALGFRPT